VVVLIGRSNFDLSPHDSPIDVLYPRGTCIVQGDDVTVSPPDPPLADDAIELVPLASIHATELDALAQDELVRRYTLVPSDPPPGFGATWADRYATAWRDGSGRAGFTIRDRATGEFLGLVMLVRLDLDAGEGEAGYVLAPAARGRGAAARALRLVTGWSFDTLGLERIELRIDATNAASEAVACRAGYIREGVLRSTYFKEGRRADVGVWSCLRSDRA